MASADQLKALLASHIEGDDDRFHAVAMQVAAHEARLGHGKLAEDLRALIDNAKSQRGAVSPVPINRPRGELASLLEVSSPRNRLGDMILGDTLAGQLQRVMREQRHAGRIVAHGLSPRRKLLLIGPPGTGKTLTASILAGELGLPLLQVRLDGLITRYMGETAAKLRQIFDATSRTRGIYFFDEFDAIGSQRGLANDVGEIRMEADVARDARQSAGIDEKGLGLQIEFESFPEVELAFESLARERSGIELLNVRKEDGSRTLATVLVPDGKLDRFENLVRDYLTEKRDSTGRARDNRKLIDAIRQIRTASLRALWTDSDEAFPVADEAPFWWEVWLPLRGNRDATTAAFRERAEAQGIRVAPGEVW